MISFWGYEGESVPCLSPSFWQIVIHLWPSLACRYITPISALCLSKFSLFKKIVYLFIFSERKVGRKRGRETSMCGCLLCAPYWGPGQQPRHVPWLGIEPVALGFTGWHSIHWATSVRAKIFSFNKDGSHIVIGPTLMTSSWLHLQRPYFQIRPHSEDPQVRTLVHLGGGGGHNSTLNCEHHWRSFQRLPTHPLSLEDKDRR